MSLCMCVCVCVCVFMCVSGCVSVLKGVQKVQHMSPLIPLHLYQISLITDSRENNDTIEIHIYRSNNRENNDMIEIHV